MKIMLGRGWECWISRHTSKITMRDFSLKKKSYRHTRLMWRPKPDVSNPLTLSHFTLFFGVFFGWRTASSTLLWYVSSFLVYVSCKRGYCKVMVKIDKSKHSDWVNFGVIRSFRGDFPEFFISILSHFILYRKKGQRNENCKKFSRYSDKKVADPQWLECIIHVSPLLWHSIVSPLLLLRLAIMRVLIFLRSFK